MLHTRLKAWWTPSRRCALLLRQTATATTATSADFTASQMGRPRTVSPTRRKAWSTSVKLESARRSNYCRAQLDPTTNLFWCGGRNHLPCCRAIVCATLPLLSLWNYSRYGYCINSALYRIFLGALERWSIGAARDRWHGVQCCPEGCTVLMHCTVLYCIYSEYK